MVVGRRNVSTVSPQALFMMNHPFVVEQSRLAARRLLAQPGLDESGRIDASLPSSPWAGRRPRPSAGSP